MENLQVNRQAEIIGLLPAGALVDSTWMDQQGVSHSLRHYYLAKGDLAKVERGLYMKKTEDFSETLTHSWMTVVSSLAQIMNRDFHIGGEFALKLDSILHSARCCRDIPVFLYGEDFPNWLSRINVDRPIILRKTDLFTDAEAEVCTAQIGSFEQTIKTTCQVSSDERAILEAIAESVANKQIDELETKFRQCLFFRPIKLLSLFKKCTNSNAIKALLELGDKFKCDWAQDYEILKFKLQSRE